MIFGVETKWQWLLAIKKIPLIGGIFLFVICFVPAVALTFAVQYLFPAFSGDPYFGRILGVFLTIWNLLLYLSGINFRIIFIPAWLMSGVIALLRYLSGAE